MEYTIREKNGSTLYANGKRFKTLYNGYVTVTAQLDTGVISSRGKKVYPCFMVQFDDGTDVIAWNSTLKSGKIRNPNAPSVCGVGVVGKETSSVKDKNGKHTPEYSIWTHMIQRCQNWDKGWQYDTYRNVSVCQRWLHFPSFCTDIKELDGYAEWKKYGTRKYQLDKDIKQRGVVNKVYSKETCLFTTNQQNTTESNQRNNISGKTYLAIRLSDGYEELFVNQMEFCRKYNLQSQNVSNILNKKPQRHTCKGWTFKIVAE